MHLLALTLLLVSLSPVAAHAGPTLEAQTAATEASSRRALVDKYCVTCHNKRARQGGLELDGVNVDPVTEHPEVWEKVVRKLRAGAMPPLGLPKPDDQAMAGFVTGLEEALGGPGSTSAAFASQDQFYATLNDAVTAPAGGALVSLSASDPVTVPPSALMGRTR